MKVSKAELQRLCDVMDEASCIDPLFERRVYKLGFGRTYPAEELKEIEAHITSCPKCGAASQIWQYKAWVGRELSKI